MLLQMYVNLHVMKHTTCFRNYVQRLNNSHVFSRVENLCLHSRLFSVDTKRNCNHIELRNCNSPTRKIHTLRPTYGYTLQRDRRIIKSNYVMPMNIVSFTPIKDPCLQLRHISGQSGDITTGVASRIFLWLSESLPVSYAQELLLYVHSSSGLPWWATIMLTTVVLRTVVTLPLAVYQNYILAKVENLQALEMPEIVKELKKEATIAMKQFNWTEKYTRRVYNHSLKKEWDKLIIRDNCHPLKASLLIWVQLPMWIFLSVALRNLVYMLPHSDGAATVTYMELSVGGVGWIPNLLVPDESLVLPFALGLINLAIVELQLMSKIRKDSKLQKYSTNVFRVLCLIMIPIAATVPSCLTLYWMTSSTYGLVQNLILLSPRIKRLTHIPESPSELEKPYKHIASEIRRRASEFPYFWKPSVRD